MTMIELKGGKRKWFSLQLRLMRSSLHLTPRSANTNFISSIRKVNIITINFINFINVNFFMKALQVEENQKTKILIQVSKQDQTFAKCLQRMLSSSRSQIKLVIFSSQGRLLHPRSLLGVVAASELSFLASPSNNSSTVGQNDRLVGVAYFFILIVPGWLVFGLLFFYWLLPRHRRTLGPSGFLRSFTCTIIDTWSQ